MVTKKRPKVENERGEATDQKRGDVIGASWIFQSNNVNDQRKKNWLNLDWNQTDWKIEWIDSIFFLM